MPETCDAAICSGWLLLTLKSVAFTDDESALMDKITVELDILSLGCSILPAESLHRSLSTRDKATQL